MSAFRRGDKLSFVLLKGDNVVLFALSPRTETTTRSASLRSGAIQLYTFKCPPSPLCLRFAISILETLVTQCHVHQGHVALQRTISWNDELGPSVVPSIFRNTTGSPSSSSLWGGDPDNAFKDECTPGITSVCAVCTSNNKPIPSVDMPAVHPPVTTLAVIKEIQENILQDYTEPAQHLSVILFATGHDAPEIITTPYTDGLLSVTRWLCDDMHLNYYVSSSETTFVGVRRHMFKRFPTSRGIPFPHAYSMFYWAQDLKMPVNQALLSCCAGAAENRLLRGNIIVVKHRQSSRDKFEDMTTEDMALVASVVGSAVGGSLLDCVDEYDMALNAIEV
ncbi:hypothetical protein L210DRAFT_3511517 [Boletus edulis BED1]|uniref:Uncharacterized protein n=1 Tax=Boletus edulis BED1 TaxID=1328754 RepID=A0AAD4G5S6_BOLED|nr:hypothetical protein L210DRAFT_3511517 [Boletus edulis BED1]